MTSWSGDTGTFFCRPDVRKTTKRTGFGRDGEKHVELCLDAVQSFKSLALFSVDMFFGRMLHLEPVVVGPIFLNLICDFKWATVTVLIGQ